MFRSLCVASPIIIVPECFSLYLTTAGDADSIRHDVDIAIPLQLRSPIRPSTQVNGLDADLWFLPHTHEPTSRELLHAPSCVLVQDHDLCMPMLGVLVRRALTCSLGTFV